MELTPNITKEGLIPFIEEQGKQLHKMIEKAREELGGRYNRRNEYEMLYEKFGDPRFRAGMFYDEYILIVKKVSKTPASVRNTIRKICDNAVQRYFVAYMEQENRKKKEAEKAAENPQHDPA